MRSDLDAAKDLDEDAGDSGRRARRTPTALQNVQTRVKWTARKRARSDKGDAAYAVKHARRAPLAEKPDRRQFEETGRGAGGGVARVVARRKESSDAGCREPRHIS